MMFTNLPHRMARKFLELAHRFAPLRRREWADAMLAELEFIEGPGRPRMVDWIV